MSSLLVHWTRRAVMVTLTGVIVMFALNTKGQGLAFVPINIKAEVGMLSPSKNIFIGNGAISVESEACGGLCCLIKFLSREDIVNSAAMQNGAVGPQSDGAWSFSCRDSEIEGFWNRMLNYVGDRCRLQLI
jgi:hypothetical protein